VVSGMRPTGSLHLGHLNGAIHNWLELQQGFETYETALREPADFVHARARRILEADDPRPVFLYLHYMDVHGPYVAQRDESLPTLGPVEERARRPLTRAEKKKVPSYLRIPKARTVSGYVDAYDRGIQIWDRSFGEFARWLDETGRLGNTIVVIVSDHGEELLEHGGWNHGLTVFEEQIYVPWILRIPGEAGRRIDGAAVSLIDVGQFRVNSSFPRELSALVENRTPIAQLMP